MQCLKQVKLLRRKLVNWEPHNLITEVLQNHPTLNFFPVDIAHVL